MPAGRSKTTSLPCWNATCPPATRQARGLRIKAAGFPARKTLEDFDWDTQPTTRQQVAAGLRRVPARSVERRTAGPTRKQGKHIWRRRSGSPPPDADIGYCSRPRPTGSPDSPTRTGKGTRPASSPDYDVTDRSSSTRSATCRSSKNTANLFFQPVSSRYKHASLILTSNLPFSR
jgi:hypothetical protein